MAKLKYWRLIIIPAGILGSLLALLGINPTNWQFWAVSLPIWFIWFVATNILFEDKIKKRTNN